MSALPSSSYSAYSPPPYIKTVDETISIPISSVLNENNITQNHHNYQRICYLCKNKSLPSNITRDLGPYLIHHSRPGLVQLCPCLYTAHLICLKKMNKDYTCNQCNSIYRTKRSIGIAQFLCVICHLLSLLSAIGLVFGLSQLGRALDELGLGSEMGQKLDGDENWQDHEMLEIVNWLNTVHFATGLAGGALLGLVYIVGVSLVIRLDRTLIMISNILYIRLDPLLKYDSALKKWLNITCVYICLFILGLTLGTYLLFFSWIWASVLHHIRKRMLNFRS
ncbi:uncharacterized protein BX663DRAFT_501850 [Cokeromyces recurvatus]|uniref:uncharacterized protein n=1 Tax=Cokeromyces recurvatus TaxID=90255 RepID=UPI00221EBAEE|nr:uncharacterized protein BX663DRAFT_501850 [Cokeromyces recurvatus]KAI7905125.1 hypothetical protein BX663DRAFT_501850 [Cokeromyces recurvatus]